MERGEGQSTKEGEHVLRQWHTQQSNPPTVVLCDTIDYEAALGSTNCARHAKQKLKAAPPPPPPHGGPTCKTKEGPLFLLLDCEEFSNNINLGGRRYSADASGAAALCGPERALLKHIL